MASPKRLTDIGIKNLPARTKRYEVPDPGARGLYVVVHPSGKTSFAVRYRHAGLPRKLTLQGGVSLAAARKLCADALHEVAQGRDPVEAKKAHKAHNRRRRGQHRAVRLRGISPPRRRWPAHTQPARAAPKAARLSAHRQEADPRGEALRN